MQLVTVVSMPVYVILFILKGFFWFFKKLVGWSVNKGKEFQGK
jgi:hypothetical protein